MDKQWFLYLLQCGDGTLYCGITDDVPRRLRLHEAGRGAKYTRGRGPLHLVYLERCADHAAALRREYAVKKLPRKEKLALLSDDRELCAFRHRNAVPE